MVEGWRRHDELRNFTLHQILGRSNQRRCDGWWM